MKSLDFEAALPLLEPLELVEGKHELRLGGVTRTVKVKAGQRETIR